VKSSSWSDHVHPHGALQQLGPNLWMVTGSLKRGKMPRNMVVHKLPTGGLWLHSVIALDEPTMATLQAIGKPEVLVVPSAIHRLDAAVWKERFPDIRVLAPRVAVDAATKRVRVNGDCETALPAMGITCHVPPGVKASELVYELSTGDGRALIFNDALMNIPNIPGFEGSILRWLGSTGFFGVTRVGKLLLNVDPPAFRSWLETMAETAGLSVITVSHGTAITADCANALRAAAARL
jgi:hypothetical protein